MAIIGNGGHYRQLIAEGCDRNTTLVAIGHCGDRRKEAEAHGGPFDKFVSARASLYVPRASIGEGSQVMSGAAVYAPLGKHCIVGTNAVVSHDVVCGDYVFIGPGAVVAGYAVLESGCFVAAGAIVTPHAVVPAGMLLKAGARISRDYRGGGMHVVPEGGMVPLGDNAQ